MRYLLALFAGSLSVLSPCILPLLPATFAAASQEHKYGALALPAGVSLSFAAIGTFVAAVGFPIGLDNDLFRFIGSVLLSLAGVILLVPAMQSVLVLGLHPLSAAASRTILRTSKVGLSGQFILGALLGAIWLPCAGPTLGAASLLAATGGQPSSAAITMALFAVGATFPLLLIGSLARETLTRWHGSLAGVRNFLRVSLGASLVVFGAAVLTGMDKAAERILVSVTPTSLSLLTTSF